jgi:hypothetical protein
VGKKGPKEMGKNGIRQNGEKGEGRREKRFILLEKKIKKKKKKA